MRTHNAITMAAAAAAALALLVAGAAAATGAGAGAGLPTPVADVVGARVAITDKGMNFASQIALPLILAQLKDIKIPDVTFDKDGFTGGISSIDCKNVQIGKLTLKNGATGLALAASGVAVSCTADWNYKLKIWPHVPSGHGSVTISVGGGSSLSATLSISSNGEKYTSLALPACHSGVDVTGLHFSGGLSGDILNLISSLLKSTIESEINSQLCAGVKTALVDDVNPMLAKSPADDVACANLPTTIACDFSLTGANPDLPSPLPLPVPALPVPDATVAATHELLIMLDPTPLNYAMYLVWNAGIMDLIITPDMLPASFPLALNTSSFQLIAPGIYKKYPDMGMQMELNVTKAPTFVDTESGDLNITARTNFGFGVLDPSAGLVPGFTLECPITVGLTVNASVNASTGQQVIHAKSPYIECELGIVSSAVGNVTVDALQQILSYALSGVVVPKINQLLAAGFAVPSLGPVNLTNTEVGFRGPQPSGGSGYLLVATDLKYATPPSPAAAAAVPAALASEVKAWTSVPRLEAALRRLIAGLLQPQQG